MRFAARLMLDLSMDALLEQQLQEERVGVPLISSLPAPRADSMTMTYAPANRIGTRDVLGGRRELEGGGFRSFALRP